MSKDTRILVASDVRGDADLVCKLLREEFGNVMGSTHAQRAVHDFEQHRPEVLVLAFNSLEKSERYYLGLYRLSTLAHGMVHRTIILCSKDELQRVYALCRQQHFDDYVLFWPLTHDAPRLPMAVHQAARQLAATSGGEPSVAEFAAQARRLVTLESLLEKYALSGGERLDAATRSLQHAQQSIGLALDGFSQQLSRGEFDAIVTVKDALGLQREFSRLKSGEIATELNAMSAAVQPMRDWAGALTQDLAPQLETARALQTLAERVRPLVLLVDDDEFQHHLLGTLLKRENIELACAASGAQALASLRQRRPDLILMDVGLPDIDGVEVTRRIKAIDQYAAVPIVMITGQSDKDVVVQSVKVGAADFVVKPFNQEKLLVKIRHHLNGDARPAG